MHTHTSAIASFAPAHGKKILTLLACGLLLALPRLAADENNIIINGSGTATNPAGTVITSATYNGIQITDTGAGANLAVNNGNIKVTGSSLHGIDVSSMGGSISIINTGTITNTGTVSVTGGHGINSANTGAGAINITVSGSASITTGNGSAISAVSADGNITITATASTLKITSTTATGAFAAINAVSSGSGNIDVQAGGNFVANGNSTKGWNLESARGNINAVMTSGTITATAVNSAGIVATATAGNVSLTFGGRVNTTGQNATAVSITAGGIASINSTGVITTTGTNSGGFVATGNSVDIRLGAGSVLVSGVNSSAIAITATTSSVVSIEKGVTVTGGRGTGAGIKFTGGSIHTIENAGSILSYNDVAISSTGAAILNINNNGTITGIITGGAGDVTITNNGTWILRSYMATSATSRSTSTVAVSNLGGGNNIIANNGIVSIAASAAGGTFTTTGQYLPFGDTSYGLKASGGSQAQLVNVNTFHNAGSLDFANGSTNDVFIITGGTIPGANGNGSYISHGGRLILDVFLNTGAERRADLLVVDNVEGGATLIDVKRMYASRGALTTGDGIPLVEVKGACGPDAFVLEHPVGYGVYEYRLYQGPADPGTSNTSLSNNWYLRSNYNPAIGGNLVNWHEGVTMFRSTEHDRRGSTLLDMGTDTAPASSEDKESSAWFRASARHSKITISDYLQECTTDNITIQAGTDVINQDSFFRDGDLLRIGIFGAYGNSFTTTKSLAIDDRATARVQGYNGTLFASWFADPSGKRGPYVDITASLYQFDNALDDNINRHFTYGSKGWAASLETGWAWTIQKYKITLEPQAQVFIDQLSMDSHVDAAGVHIYKSTDQFITTRAGLRVHGNVKSSLRLYTEFNWWHNFQDIELYFDKTLVTHSNPRDLWQIKVGAQADLGKSWTLWGNTSLQTGKSYTEMGIILGLRLNW